MESADGQSRLEAGETVTVNLESADPAVLTVQSTVSVVGTEDQSMPSAEFTVNSLTSLMQTVTLTASVSNNPAESGVVNAIFEPATLNVDIIRRLFNISFNPPDTVEVVAGSSARLDLTLEGVDGSQLFGSESVTVTMVVENLAVGSVTIDAVEPIAANSPVAILGLSTPTAFIINPTANVPLAQDHVIALTVGGYDGSVGSVDSGNSLNLVSELFDVTSEPVPAIAVTVRQFRLVFSDAMHAQVRGGGSAMVSVIVESADGQSRLEAGETVTVNLESADPAVLAVQSTVSVVGTDDQLAPIAEFTVNSLTSLMQTVTLTASVSNDSSESGVINATFEPAALNVDIIRRLFNISFNPPDTVEVVAGSSARLDLTLEGVDGSQLFSSESVTATMAVAAENQVVDEVRIDAVAPIDANARVAILELNTPTAFTINTTVNVPLAQDHVIALIVGGHDGSAGSVVSGDSLNLAFELFDVISAPVPALATAVRQFRLVFSDGMHAQVRGGGSAMVSVIVESADGQSRLEADEIVTVNLESADATVLTVQSMVLVAGSVEFTVNSLTSLMQTVTLTASVSNDSSESGAANATFESATLNVDIIRRLFNISFNPPDTVEVVAGSSTRLDLTLEGVDGSRLFGSENVTATMVVENLAVGSVTIDAVEPIATNSPVAILGLSTPTAFIINPTVNVPLAQDHVIALTVGVYDGSVGSVDSGNSLNLVSDLFDVTSVPVPMLSVVERDFRLVFRDASSLQEIEMINALEGNSIQVLVSLLDGENMLSGTENVTVSLTVEDDVDAGVVVVNPSRVILSKSQPSALLSIDTSSVSTEQTVILTASVREQDANDLAGARFEAGELQVNLEIDESAGREFRIVFTPRQAAVNATSDGLAKTDPVQISLEGAKLRNWRECCFAI